MFQSAFLKACAFHFAILLPLIGISQQTFQVPNSDLYIELPDDFDLSQADGSFYCDQYAFSIMYFSGISFTEERSDFDDIEDGYAEKGLTVVSKVEGRLADYEAIFLHIKAQVDLYQVVFGNGDFMAMANVTPVGELTDALKEEIRTRLSAIEHRPSELSPLEEHAHFAFDTETSGYSFMTYNGVMFAFEKPETQEALMVMQLPANASLAGEQALLEQFAAKFAEDGLALTVVEEGPLEVDDFKGYYKLLQTEGDSELRYLAMFATSTPESSLIVQLFLNEQEGPVAEECKRIFGCLSRKK